MRNHMRNACMYVNFIVVHYSPICPGTESRQSQEGTAWSSHCFTASDSKTRPELCPSSRTSSASSC